MIMNEALKIKIEGVKSELGALFPQGEITMVHGENNDKESQPYDDYMLVITGINGKRIGFLKMKFYGGDEVVGVELYRERQFQVSKKIWGISWYVSRDGRYKKPNNHQELELFINHVWGILN